jgi:hypothetical protein
MKWKRRPGTAEVYDASSPLGPLVVRQKPDSTTWQAMLGNIEVATGYTSIACKRAAEENIERMRRKQK